MITRKLSLSENITAFCQHLRSHQFIIGPREEADALIALGKTSGFESADKMRLCLQTVLCKEPKQIRVFPDLYYNYWRELNKAVDSKEKKVEEEGKGSKTGNKKPPSLVELKSWLFQGKLDEEEGSVATYSAEGGAGQLGTDGWTEDGLSELRKIIQLLIRKVAKQPSRRFTKTKKKKTPDIRRTFRQSLKFGLDIFPLHFKEPKESELKISGICDVSKSMDLYSRFVLQFMYAFRKEYAKIECFAFDTTLHHLSSHLEKDSLEKGIDAIAQSELEWGGGTKIGHSLDLFRKQFGQKMLGGKSIVIIVSDGWDTGDMEVLEFNMRHLQRKCNQVIWINPLAGHPDWKAEVRGMATALKYVDVFVPAFDVGSLRRFLKVKS